MRLVPFLRLIGISPAEAVARALEELGDGAGLNELIRVGLKRAAG